MLGLLRSLYLRCFFIGVKLLVEIFPFLFQVNNWGFCWLSECRVNFYLFLCRGFLRCFLCISIYVLFGLFIFISSPILRLLLWVLRLMSRSLLGFFFRILFGVVLQAYTGVGSLSGSICSRSNGTFNNLLFLYTWKYLTSYGVKTSDAICVTCKNVSFCRKRSSKASSSWVNCFIFTIAVKSLTMPFGSYYLPRTVANFIDFMISASFHVCPKSCSANAPNYNENVGQMAFFCSFNPLLNPPSPIIW